jgi:hypothetical protein
MRIGYRFGAVRADGGFWGGAGAAPWAPRWPTPAARPDSAGLERTDHHRNGDRGCSAPTVAVCHRPHQNPWVITRTTT